MKDEKSLEKEILSTRDLCLAATLVTLKFPMLGIDCEVEGAKKRPVGFFKFEKTSALEDTRVLYIQGFLSVEPKVFYSNLNTLKTEVIETISNPHKHFGENSEEEK